MNVGACACLPITAAMSRLDLRIGVSLPGPLRRAGLPRPGPAASGTGRGRLDADRARSTRRRRAETSALWMAWRPCELDVVGWACQDLNLGPLPYQGSALTD
jgi:hypothetical protein